MNKVYEAAEITVIEVESEDVLTTSGDLGDWDANSRSSLFPN